MSTYPDRIIRGWEAAYRQDEQATVVDFRSLANEVTPDSYTHQLHPYPAKLLLQIPHFLLQAERLAGNSKTAFVADPFCGSGTVLLEAALKGHRAVGSDTNPLARLIARVKARPVSPTSVEKALERVRSAEQTSKEVEPPKVVNLLEWYSKPVVRRLTQIRSAIAAIEDRSSREFLQVCFSVCARRMSRADPRLSVPVRIDLARKRQYGQHFEQLNEHLKALKAANVFPLFFDIAQRNLRRAQALRAALPSRPFVRIYDDARTLHRQTGESSVDLIITSPPYLGAQKYIRASSLNLGWLDLAYENELRPLEQKTIGREHFLKAEIGTSALSKIAFADELLCAVEEVNPLRAHMAWTYLSEMQQALDSMQRLLKPGGHLVLVTGPNTICGYHFDTPAYLEQLAHRAGLRTTFKLIDHIRSRGLMTKRNRTAGFIASEWVLCLRKGRR